LYCPCIYRTDVHTYTQTSLPFPSLPTPLGGFACPALRPCPVLSCPDLPADKTRRDETIMQNTKRTRPKMRYDNVQCRTIIIRRGRRRRREEEEKKKNNNAPLCRPSIVQGRRRICLLAPVWRRPCGPKIGPAACTMRWTSCRGVGCCFSDCFCSSYCCCYYYYSFHSSLISTLLRQGV